MNNKTNKYENKNPKRINEVIREEYPHLADRIESEKCNDFGKEFCGISQGADMFDASYCWKRY